MPAMDALHMKVQFAEDLGDLRMRSYLNSFVSSVEGLGKAVSVGPDGKTYKPVPNPGTFESMSGDEVADRWRLWVEMSYTFYVAPAMKTLIGAASESMPQEHIVPGDLPTEQGFMWIPGGVGAMDVNGNLLKHNAVLWNVHGGQVTVVWLVDKQDPEDSGNIKLQASDPTGFAQMARLTPNHVTGATFGRPLPLTFGPNMLKPDDVEIRVERIKTEDGLEFRHYLWGPGAAAYRDQIKLETITDPAMRWLLTCWRLMQQTVTRVVDEEAPRALRRQAQRAQLRDKAVSVIQLRHRSTAEHSGESDPREWSHQWLVRGHWRNQPCKEDGVWTTRLVWIHPYVKGPDDKPLLVRDHVYSLVR